MAKGRRRKFSLVSLFRMLLLVLLAVIFIYFLINELHRFFPIATLILILILIIFLFPIGRKLFTEVKNWHTKRQIELAFKNGGGLCNGVISGIEETRRWLDNKTYIRFSVIYEFEDEKFVGELRKITDVMVIPDVGHAIDVIYDPKRDKVYFKKWSADSFVKT